MDKKKKQLDRICGEKIKFGNIGWWSKLILTWKRRLTSDWESRIDRGKLTVDRFSINFRGRERNGSVETFPVTFNGISFLLPSPVIPVARVLSCLNRGFKVPREIVHSTCTWRLRGRPIRHPEFKMYMGIRFQKHDFFSFSFVANFTKIYIVVIVT